MSDIYQTANGSITVEENCLAIHTKSNSTNIPFDEISDVQLSGNFYLGLEKFIIQTQDGKVLSFSFKSRDRDQYVTLQTKLHQYLKIHVYEEKTCRTHIHRSTSFYDYLPLVVATPFIIAQFVAAVLLLYTPVGIFFSPPLAIFSILIIRLILRTSFGSIEGECPVCRKPFKTSKYNKHITCKFCMHQILIKKDYFEVIVPASFFEKPKEEEIDDFDDDDDEIDERYYR